MNMNLYDGKTGEIYRVTEISSSPAQKQRLKAMGLKVGTDVEILGIAPFMGAVMIKAGTIRLALRSDLAKKIVVEKQ